MTLMLRFLSRIKFFYYVRLRGGFNFSHRCCFKQQMNYKGLRYGDGEMVEVPMKSGKVGLYRVTSERYNILFDNTGQRNWYFEFINYK